MTNATDNLTTELRELLDERGVEYVIGYDQKGTSAVETTYFEHDGKSVEFMAWVDIDHTKLTAYDLTPEQAIAATLGSEREAKLERLVRSLYADYYDEWPDRAEEVYADRMKELGIEVIDE